MFYMLCHSLFWIWIIVTFWDLLTDASIWCFCWLLISYFRWSSSLLLPQNIVESLSEKNSLLENELSTARKNSDDTMEKLKDVEGKCTRLQQNLDKYAFPSAYK